MVPFLSKQFSAKCTLQFLPGLSPDVQDPGAGASFPLVAHVVQLLTLCNS